MSKKGSKVGQLPDSASSISPTQSWDGGDLAAEIGIDPELMKNHKKRHKKVHIDKSLKWMTNLKKNNVDDRKRQEEVLASYLMKDLTSKYGSKGKSPKQYFMEAYDEDTKTVEMDQENVHHFDAKGREITATHKYHLQKEESANRGEKEMEPPCSPIVFDSVVDLAEDAQEKALALAQKSSTPDFWDSLNRLERLQLGSSDDSALSLCTTSTPRLDDFSSQHRNVNDADNSISYSTTEDQSNNAIKEAGLDKYLEPIQEVVQSIALRRAWDRVVHHLDELNVKDPMAYEMFGKIYEETRDFVRLPEEDVKEFERGNWEPVPVNEGVLYELEPPEKLFSRFAVYQNAMMYIIEHFETLRPLLAEIKQAYGEVFEKCEKEWKDLDRLRLEQLRLRDEYGAHVRKKDKEGDRALTEVRLQAFALQEHIQWQQHTLHTILGILWKMRNSLQAQSKIVERSVTNYKNKVEILAKEIVSQQGQGAFDMAIPGKYTEIMEQFKNIKDPKEARKILQLARRQLRKTNKQIIILEADYADTVPRTEFDLYHNKYMQLKSKNDDVIKKSELLKENIERLKNNIEEKGRRKEVIFGFGPPEYIVRLGEDEDGNDHDDQEEDMEPAEDDEIH